MQLQHVIEQHKFHTLNSGYQVLRMIKVIMVVLMMRRHKDDGGDGNADDG